MNIEEAVQILYEHFHLDCDPTRYDGTGHGSWAGVSAEGYAKVKAFNDRLAEAKKVLGIVDIPYNASNALKYAYNEKFFKNSERGSLA